MCDKPQNECGSCASEHFGALVNQTARVVRRALDARITADVSPELSGEGARRRAAAPPRRRTKTTPREMRILSCLSITSSFIFGGA